MPLCPGWNRVFLPLSAIFEFMPVPYLLYGESHGFSRVCQGEYKAKIDEKLRAEAAPVRMLKDTREQGWTTGE